MKGGAAAPRAIGAGEQGRADQGHAAQGQHGAAAQGGRGAAIRPLAWATAAFVAGTLLNADRVPTWVPVVSLVLVGWRMWCAWRALRLPSTLARSLLAVVMVLGVLARFHTLNGLSAGTALLILMGASKLLETGKPRDELIVVGVSLFLLLAAVLDRQALLRAPLYLVQVWICCTAIAVIAYSPTPGSRLSGQGFDDRTALKLAGRTLLLAAPLALVLFIFFPRLAGAFWALPRSDLAITGLSDTMSPGSITTLTTSYDIAFRVRFDGPAPPPPMRYWRGPVLHDFDGYTWRRTFTGPYRKPPLEYRGAPYRYRVLLEPSSQRWWFALDTVRQRPDASVFLTEDNELIGTRPVNETTAYTAISYTDVGSTAPLTQGLRRRDTQPVRGNPRSHTFARDLRARLGSDSAYIGAVLEFLRTGGFQYTLTPPALGPDSVDDFLFNTRRGFCGHFASAFVALMREAGVPAHVVTGYLGGEWNPVGGYLIVRQSDAHAWAEVWLDGRGWTRVDPTAVVAPERLNRGILDLLPNAGSAEARLIRASSWLTALVQRWDAANAWWTEHVVKFDFKAQTGLLERLGIEAPDASDLGWALAGGLLLWMLWIAWQHRGSAPPPRRDRLTLAYSRLCAKLAKVGIERAPHQGPLAFAGTVTQRRPDLANTVGMLLGQYAQLRFGPGSTHDDAAAVADFERAVRRIDVGAHQQLP
jgi:protein-glutamine gamma-glutamyltransferase